MALKRIRQTLEKLESRQSCISAKQSWICPVTWGSELQMKITTSTMMAEYIALSMALQELFSL
eukprot:15364571-Ditylum_brightwellii.AAC.2